MGLPLKEHLLQSDGVAGHLAWSVGRFQDKLLKSWPCQDPFVRFDALVYAAKFLLQTEAAINSEATCCRSRYIELLDTAKRGRVLSVRLLATADLIDYKPICVFSSTWSLSLWVWPTTSRLSMTAAKVFFATKYPSSPRMVLLMLSEAPSSCTTSICCINLFLSATSCTCTHNYSTHKLWVASSQVPPAWPLVYVQTSQNEIGCLPLPTLM